MTETTEFRPDWISAPGDTIGDILEHSNMSEREFSRQLGKTPQETQDLLHGQGAITLEIAKMLENLIGGSTTFWMARERRYREDLDRLRGQAEGNGGSNWLDELPIKDMVRFGWLPRPQGSADKIAASLRFFGVANVRAWREAYRTVLETAAFRTSPAFESQPGAVAAWLRQGEIESSKLACKAWDAKKFRQIVGEIRCLSRKKVPSVFVPELQRRFAECGAAVVILRAPSGCRASGATCFLSNSKALMLLSFRYLSDDHFWFSVFHEAAHLILHENTAIFLEGPNIVSTKEEEEANQYAADTLIPPEFRSEMLKLPINGREVMRFARRIGVSPGVVVGQLQHLGRLERRQLNNLKRRYQWSSE
jgi:plasmid maintenance system antidote protein VapI/Zn-dependent peptidase ImmA (M78 family)